MNKAFCKKRVFLSFLLTGCLILFYISCGLDTFYILPGPSLGDHSKPDYTSADYAENYFDFWTNEAGCAGVKFNGTDVYYKIYTNTNTLKSQRTALDTIIENETGIPAETLKDQYKYMPLKVANHEGELALIPASASKSNQHVIIRLSDFTDIYPAEILVNGHNIYGESNRVIPLRYVTDDNGNALSFNFSQSDVNTLPKASQNDVNSTGGTSEENVWYVCLYAVTVADDPSYTNKVYSNLLYLGSVKIPAQ